MNKCCVQLERVEVGKKVPNFIASAVLPDGKMIDNFSLEYELKHAEFVVLVFYPLNFTFVCPTELIAIDNRMSHFENKNVRVVAVSVDSKFSHLQWRKMKLEKGGIGHVSFPLISDMNHKISKLFGVFNEEKSVAMRGVFIIDKKSVLRHMSINDFGVGRNFDEVLRLLDAIAHHDTHGHVCPAGWTASEEVIQENTESVGDYLANNGNKL